MALGILTKQFRLTDGDERGELECSLDVLISEYINSKGQYGYFFYPMIFNEASKYLSETSKIDISEARMRLIALTLISYPQGRTFVKELNQSMHSLNALTQEMTEALDGGNFDNYIVEKFGAIHNSTTVGDYEQTLESLMRWAKEVTRTIDEDDEFGFSELL